MSANRGISVLVLWMVVGCAPEGADLETDLDGCASCDGSVAEPPDTEGNVESGLPADTVCFPGDGNEICLPVYQLDPLPDELVYGEGPAASYFQNNPRVSADNYRAPIAFLDLEEAYAVHGNDVKIYPNFRLSEIGQARVGRWAVIQPHAFDKLQAMRERMGPTSVVSGYRSPGYNAAGGGAGRAQNSRHMWGDAFDFDPPVSLEAAKAECEELGAYFINLYTTHIHCDWRHLPVDERFFGPSVADSERRRRAASSEHHSAVAYDASISRSGNLLRVEVEGFDEGQPVIEWHAYDALDQRIASGQGPSFESPDQARTVYVTVAGWLIRTEVL